VATQELVNEDGYVMDSGYSLLEVKPLWPRSDREREDELKRGPLYQICFSINRYKDAMAEQDALNAKYQGKVRVLWVPARAEIAAIAEGKFKITTTSGQARIGSTVK